METGRKGWRTRCGVRGRMETGLWRGSTLGEVWLVPASG